MPYEVKKNSSKFCVYKKGASTPIKGGCHPTREEAIKHLRALYANVPDAKRASETVIFDVSRTFAEADLENDKIVWIEALPAKTWHTMQYGEVAITPEKLHRFVENFKANVRGQEIATDYEHGLDPAKGTKASGWYRDFDVRPNADGTFSLWAAVEFTDTAKQEIKNKEWKYFSLDWHDYYNHPETNEMHEDVVVGGGLTNRPVAKGMVPINFSEVFIASGDLPAGVTGKTLSEVFDEVADLEHSEPGTGNPPQPKEQESGDSAIESGSRRDPLPVPREDMEASVMTDEQLKALKELYGIEGDDGDADAVIAKAKEIVANKQTSDDRVKELETELDDTKKKLPVDTQAALKFAEQYPDEHKRMVELENVNRANSAKAFAESIRRFSEVDGEKTRVTKYGLSGLALQTIEEAHKKFSEGTGTLADFEGAIDSVVKTGIVDYGEHGSSSQPDIPDVDVSGTATGIANNRKAFSEAVNKKREDAASAGKELSLQDAIREVTRENPELAAAYRQSASA